MAKNIFSKLNTLVQASVRDSLKGLSGRKPKTADPAGWRQRYENALQILDTKQAQIDALTAQILQADELADRLVGTGKEAEARQAIEQMMRLKQQLTIQQSELDDLQREAQELLRYTTEIESQTTNPTPSVQEPKPTKVKIVEETPIQIDEASIEVDLSARRTRLAKPDT